MRVHQKPRPAVGPVLIAVCVIAALLFAILAFEFEKQADAKQRAVAAQQQQRAATKAILDETAGARPPSRNL